MLVDQFIASFKTAPEELVLDFDATDNPLHGQQEGRFFHGYYDCYCYLPLYVFCGQQLLCAYPKHLRCHTGVDLVACGEGWCAFQALARELQVACLASFARPDDGVTAAI